MITDIKVKNCGPLGDLKWSAGSGFNVIIGENGTGKTLLLKTLYTAIKSTEEYQRGNDKRTYRQILDEKLKWTFQLSKIGDLVTRGEGRKFRFESVIDDEKVMFTFSQSAEKGVGDSVDPTKGRSFNSVYFPAKEILSLDSIIRQSREIDRQFGFDDTYYDLVKAVGKPTQQGKNWKSFADARKGLEDIINGRVEYIDNEWFYIRGQSRYPISLTAEGVKKIAIIDRLLGNGIISPQTVLFIDEPESALHPRAVIMYLDILNLLVMQGIQVFIATHSYFVLKKLHLIALKKKEKLPVVSLTNAGVHYHDLVKGMPDNPIVEASVSLYEEEIGLDDE